MRTPRTTLWMTRIAAWMLLAAAPLAASAQQAAAHFSPGALAERAETAYRETPRRVLAFYYTWYGGPEAEYRHWGEVDREAKEIENSLNYPALGPYDSLDPEVIDRHCRMAKRAHLDGFITTWWGHDDYTDRAMPELLDTAAEHGLEITAYYEEVPDPGTPEAAAKDIVKLLERYGEHPAWLRVEGKPVLFVYSRAVNQLGLDGWLAVKQRVEEDYGPGAVLIGDRISRGAALIFDGIHTYNPVGKLRGLSLEESRSRAGQLYARLVRLAQQTQRVSAATVIPGYDDTKVRDPGTVAGRRGGELYRALWEEVIEADPDWVLITSFNEWHEGSEIEPSHQAGRKYLKLTAEYAQRFKAAPRRKLTAKEQAGGAAAISAADTAALREKLRGVNMAMLPGAESPALWWLLGEMELSPAFLSWQQIADGLDPERHPVLVYAGGEYYRPTVERPGDVDEALRSYLSKGGWLVVLPAGPMPFHYSREGKAVANTDRFGLPLSIGGEGKAAGWERPPEDAELRFVQPEERLPNVPRSLPFSSSSASRWRPLVRGALQPEDVRVPLLVLRDGEGDYRGDGAVYVKLGSGDLGGGRVLYAWFGLLRTPHSQALLHDLFAFIAERAGAGQNESAESGERPSAR